MQFSFSTVAAGLAIISTASASANTGYLLAYSQPGLSELAALANFANTLPPFCTLWANATSHQALPPIQSYISHNLTCTTYASKDCTGANLGTISATGDGFANHVNLALKSLQCVENNTF